MDKKEEESLLRAYAETTGKSVTVLRKLLEEAKKEAKASGTENDNVIKGKFRKKVRNLIYSEMTGRQVTRKEPAMFRGFILGADAIRDLKEQMRRKALRIYEEEGENAKIEGYVDENGNPIDWRPTIRNRRGEEVENPDYHKPITGHLYVRDLFGIAIKEGETKPKLFVMSLWGGFATQTSWRPFVPVEFKATIKSEGNYYVLNPPRVLQKGEKGFRKISMEIDYMQWIKEALSDREYPLTELPKAVENTRHAKDPWIIVKGIVDSIDTEVNPKTGSRTLTITDPDAGMTDVVRVFIPKDFPLAFREYSKVIVFGRPRAWKREDDDTIHYSIRGISVYPIPGETIEVPVEEVKPAQGYVEGEEEEGWDLWEE
jgi:hypothetical protein